MSGQQGAGLSIEEFERLQNQLLELKSSNYQLVEVNNKKDSELQFLSHKLKTCEDDLQRANVTIAKSKRAKDIASLEQDTDVLRHKLAVQEEEFRLQQSTLMNELNRLVCQNEKLEKSMECAQGSEDNSENVVVDNSNGEICRLKSEYAAIEAKLSDAEIRLKQAAEKSSVSDSNEGEVSKKMNALEVELNELKSVNCALKINADESQLLQEKLRHQNEEHRTKFTYFQQQVAELNEKLRKKQESYQMLSDEKERQYTEFKKSLDNVVRKKDAEIANLAEEVNHLKHSLQKTKEDEEQFCSEKQSAQQALTDFRSRYAEAAEQNEALQIQLQESHSANDCLSQQVQEARDDVTRMQQQVEEAVDNANKRKSLVDEMAKHLEKLTDEFRVEKESMEQKYVETTTSLEMRIDTLSKQSATVLALESEIDELKTLVVSKENEYEKLKVQLKENKVQLELMQIQHDEFMGQRKKEFDEKIDETNRAHATIVESFEKTIENLKASNAWLNDSLEATKQVVKDKDEELKLLERKQTSVLKDLKKQAQSEKKRADRLQEKLQEVLNEVQRNRSPGFEEVRGSDLKEAKTNGSAGDNNSVSSWSVVSNNHQKEADRHSNAGGDQDSVSSVTMLESDNQELISRVAALQKRNFELEEKVRFLEESSSGMAGDLVNKADVIAQLLKEKPLTVQTPSSPDKMHIGLKKVMDLVKIDLTAGDIRDMNKRLQLMLEETLTKNMHLQRDLEMMSNEVARLAALVPTPQKGMRDM